MKNLKPVPADKKKSLGKLPTDVRNKMGYAQKGKMVKNEKPKEKPKKPGQIFIELKKPFSKGGEMASNRRKRLKDVQNPKSEYDKKGKLKYTAAKKGKMITGKKEEDDVSKYVKSIKLPDAKDVRDVVNKKSMGGEMKKGYGAARQSGMGLQDENLTPGKSLDYYKDLM